MYEGAPATRVSMLSNPRHSTPTSNRIVDAVFGSIPAPVLLLSVALIVGAPHPSAAQEGPDPTVINDGKDDFEWQCVACHGTEGTGNGPMAKMLVKPPADLTGIAKNNSGTFPFWRVYRIISGKEAVPGHETFQMPNYWKRFSKDEKYWGFLPPHVRVLLLTHYVETLQKQ